MNIDEMCDLNPRTFCSNTKKRDAGDCKGDPQCPKSRRFENHLGYLFADPRTIAEKSVDFMRKELSDGRRDAECKLKSRRSLGSNHRVD